MQLNLALGASIAGFLLTMINTISMHLVYYYQWTPEEELTKLVLITNVLFLGSCCGCLISPFFIVKGRRFTIMSFCVVIIITSFICTIKNFYIFLTARFVSGVFYGIHGSAFPLYNIEMFPAEMVG